MRSTFRAISCPRPIPVRRPTAASRRNQACLASERLRTTTNQMQLGRRTRQTGPVCLVLPHRSHASTTATDTLELGGGSCVLLNERVPVGCSRCVGCRRRRLVLSRKRRCIVTGEPLVRALDCAAVWPSGVRAVRACAEREHGDNLFHFDFLRRSRRTDAGIFRSAPNGAARHNETPLNVLGQQRVRCRRCPASLLLLPGPHVRLPNDGLLTWRSRNCLDLLLLGFLGFPIASLFAFGHVALLVSLDTDGMPISR